MKRTALSLISLASLATAPLAHAQTSVTLYGVIDTSITYVNHAQGKDSAWLLGNSSAGNLAGSRWGSRAPRISAAG